MLAAAIVNKPDEAGKLGSACGGAVSRQGDGSDGNARSLGCLALWLNVIFLNIKVLAIFWVYIHV